MSTLTVIATGGLGKIIAESTDSIDAYRSAVDAQWVEADL